LSLELPKEAIDPDTTYVTIAVADLFFGRAATPRLVALDQHLDIGSVGHRTNLPFMPRSKKRFERAPLKLFMAARRDP
jgi:hypothetical protein